MAPEKQEFGTVHLGNDETYKLPLLPGYSSGNNKKYDFHKSQTLGFVNGYRKQIDALCLPQNAGRIPEPEVMEKILHDQITYYLHNSSKDGPCEEYSGNGKNSGISQENVNEKEQQSSVKYNKNDVLEDCAVLRFYAYLYQPLDGEDANDRILRKVTILYYLQDGTIAVHEPRRPNTGLMQGVLIRRHRIPRSPIETFKPEDFNIGCNATLYAKTFRVYDCDSFTRSYLENVRHLEVPDPEMCPHDDYLDAREPSMPSSMAGLRSEHYGIGVPPKLSRFLRLDRQVLRFYCYWEREQRRFVLHYYLVDDCVEVLEVHSPNDGLGRHPLMLKRSRLPRGVHDVAGMHTEVSNECYTWQELQVGQVINVFGRSFLIYDCDKYTREHFKAHAGVTLLAPIKVDRPTPPQPTVKLPPYTGYGTEEDSLQSCIHLVPQAPRHARDRGDKSQEMRFLAKLRSRFEQDKERRFIIVYYTADDTVSVYEPPLRNTGVLAGKFAERAVAKRPQSLGQPEGNYVLRDFYVGARIMIHGHCFEIFDADEAVYKYMEKNSADFPHADVNRIAQRLATMQSRDTVVQRLKMVAAGDADKPKTANHFYKIAKVEFGPHEYKTMVRNAQRVLEILKEIKTEE